jgi:hypothetical protein
MTEFDFDTVTKPVRDAFYVTVGAGVLAYQQAEKAWQEWTERATSQVGTGRDRFDQFASFVSAKTEVLDERAKAIGERVENALDDVEARLPERASEVFAKARHAAADARRQVRERVRPDAA